MSCFAARVLTYSGVLPLGFAAMADKGEKKRKTKAKSAKRQGASATKDAVHNSPSVKKRRVARNRS